MPSALARDLRSLPNVITLSRIVLILAASGLFFYGSRPWGIGLAVVAGVTDYLDGAVARATGQVTRLGEILDQVSDLFFESLCFVFAIEAHVLPAVALVIYLLREFWVSAIRRFMAGIGANIASQFSGKLKTNFLMWGFVPVFLSVSGLAPGAALPLAWFGRLAIATGLAFGYVSGVAYSRQFFAAYEASAVARRESV